MTKVFCIPHYTQYQQTHTYLHYRSAHPPHQKSSGPYSQLVRVKRICSKPEDYRTNSNKILEYYKLGGYPRKILQTAKARADALDRQSLLSPDQTNTNTQATHSANNKSDDKLFLITTYNPANPNIKSILEKHWPIINSARNLIPLHNNNIIVGNRRGPNLQDILVKSRIRFPPKQKNFQISGKETNICVYTDETRCIYCPKLDLSGTVTCTNTGRTYKTPEGGSCGCNNLVYLVTCKKCKCQYVGETLRTLKERFYGHFYDIRNAKNPNLAPISVRSKPLTSMAKHFGCSTHSIEDVKIQILEFIKKPPRAEDTKIFRKKRELHWIYQLKTLDPLGLNTMECIHEILTCN